MLSVVDLSAFRGLTCSVLGKCRDPPVVENAYHDGARGQREFPLG